MQHRAKIPIEIALDGKTVPSRTLATSVGAYILAIETVLPDQAIDLHSVYIGHPRTTTQATHLILTPDVQEALTAEHEHDQMPVTHARRTCLYDHCHQLQDLLQRDGTEASIPIDEQAIHAVEQ